MRVLYRLLDGVAAPTRSGAWRAIGQAAAGHRTRPVATAFIGRFYRSWSGPGGNGAPPTEMRPEGFGAGGFLGAAATAGRAGTTGCAGMAEVCAGAVGLGNASSLAVSPDT